MIPLTNDSIAVKTITHTKAKAQSILPNQTHKQRQKQDDMNTSWNKKPITH